MSGGPYCIDRLNTPSESGRIYNAIRRAEILRHDAAKP